MSDKSKRIRDLQAALAEVKQAKRELVANGQAYSIQGSHSRTSASMSELSKQERQITKSILRARGVTATHNYAGVRRGIS